MNDHILTLSGFAAITLLLALCDYHFSRESKHMQFQWWSPLIPLLAPALRSLWQTLAVVVAVVSLILLFGAPR
jgi:hypothetical protein